MNVPAVLTGSAGRAIDDLARVRAFGDAAGSALHGIVDGSLTVAQARGALHEADGVLLHGSFADLVSNSTPSLHRALGAGGLPSTMRLHASLAELESVRAALAGARTPADHLAAARRGAAMADSLVGAIDVARPALDRAARHTAAWRVSLATIAAGGTVGLLASTHR